MQTAAVTMPAPARSPLPLPRTTRSMRGRRNNHAGLAAEETVARHYSARGARLLAQRHRTPDGEIDLVLLDRDALIFVEVKSGRRRGSDSPISARQWQRLGNAALRFMVEYQQETGATPCCRFDAALMAPDGSVEVIENAREFDEF